MTRYTKITTFEPTLGRLENASQLADVQSVIEEFRDLFCVDHMVYHWVIRNVDGSGWARIRALGSAVISSNPIFGSIQ